MSDKYVKYFCSAFLLSYSLYDHRCYVVIEEPHGMCSYMCAATKYSMCKLFSERKVKSF